MDIHVRRMANISDMNAQATGTAAIAMSFGVAWITASFERWNSNIWYGAASKDLVENTIVELEKGNADRVLAELRVLRTNLNPTYENRADYDQLVAKYVYAVSDSPTLHERNDPRWADNVPEGRQPSPLLQNEVAVVADSPLIDVDAVAIGARPLVILDARFVSIHKFHQRGIANGEWICIEGSVKDSGEAMGAPFVNLVCGDCDKVVHCEGHALRKYRIPVNGNLVVRGRVFGDHLVMESDLVFQSQIDEALSNQSSSE